MRYTIETARFRRALSLLKIQTKHHDGKLSSDFSSRSIRFARSKKIVEKCSSLFFSSTFVVFEYRKLTTAHLNRRNLLYFLLLSLLSPCPPRPCCSGAVFETNERKNKNHFFQEQHHLPLGSCYYFSFLFVAVATF